MATAKKVDGEVVVTTRCFLKYSGYNFGDVSRTVEILLEEFDSVKRPKVDWHISYCTKAKQDSVVIDGREFYSKLYDAEDVPRS